MWKGAADSKKVKRLSKEEIKTQLFDLKFIDENLEFDDLNKKAEEKQDKDIIKTKKKGIINVAFHQGQIFKRFKEKEKFAKLVSELGTHKTTIILKINVFKMSKKYCKLLKSSIVLGFLTNYHKDIKAICKKNEEDFQ